MAFPLLPLLGNLAASVVSSYLGGPIGEAAGSMTGNAIKGNNVFSGEKPDEAVKNNVKQVNEQTKDTINTKPAFAQAIAPYIQQQPQQDPVATAFNTLYKPYGRGGGYG